MGKGADQSSTTTTSSLPDYVQPFYTDLLTRAQELSKRPYTPYQNPRIADFSPETLTAFDMMRKTAEAGLPGLDRSIAASEGLASYAMPGAFNPGSVGTGTFDFKSFPGADLNAYMNPYVSNVLDVEKDKALRRFQEQQQFRDADAIAAGAFGGDRRFVTDSLAQRDLNEQLNTMNAQGLSSAFDRAAALFGQDEARRLQAYEGDASRRLTADTGNAERGLSAQIASEDARRLASEFGLNALKTTGDMEALRQDLRFRNIQGISDIGAKIQGMNQGRLDLAYKDFLNQRDWSGNQLALYSQLLGGVPVTPTTHSTEIGPTPDFLSGLAGLVTGGVGLWDLLNG